MNQFSAFNPINNQKLTQKILNQIFSIPPKDYKVSETRRDSENAESMMTIKIFQMLELIKKGSYLDLHAFINSEFLKIYHNHQDMKWMLIDNNSCFLSRELNLIGCSYIIVIKQMFGLLRLISLTTITKLEGQFKFNNSSNSDFNDKSLDILLKKNISKFEKKNINDLNVYNLIKTLFNEMIFNNLEKVLNIGKFSSIYKRVSQIIIYEDIKLEIILKLIQNITLKIQNVDQLRQFFRIIKNLSSYEDIVSKLIIDNINDVEELQILIETINSNNYDYSLKCRLANKLKFRAQKIEDIELFLLKLKCCKSESELLLWHYVSLEITCKEDDCNSVSLIDIIKPLFSLNTVFNNQTQNNILNQIYFKNLPPNDILDIVNRIHDSDFQENMKTTFVKKVIESVISTYRNDISSGNKISVFNIVEYILGFQNITADSTIKQLNQVKLWNVN